MHIAFLTPEYPHERVAHAAGIGTSIKNLVVALAQKKNYGFCICVWTTRRCCIYGGRHYHSFDKKQKIQTHGLVLAS